MKPTDFSMHLTAFLSDYLPVQKNVSRNTIKSYRDTFKLLLLFCEKEESLPVEKITMKKLSSDLVVRFLNWLEAERKSSVSTRNLRLTAIHSFFRITGIPVPLPESACHPGKEKEAGRSGAPVPGRDQASAGAAGSIYSPWTAGSCLDEPDV